MQLDVDLEDWESSPTIRPVPQGYTRWSKNDFHDKPARLTARQAVFYRNLIRLALATGGSIPVDFRRGESEVFLDRGCVKIAELAGFINEIENGPNGVVDEINLAWRTDGSIADK